MVQRLRRAGAVVVAKTNMSEFAFSGLGDNPHFGTPGNPADRSRIPGGSTSGGAVAVADGMCAITIGTDTGGSTRIPAALCGLIGFKPTKSRIPTAGVFPLSPTFDSVGMMARSVLDCIMADEIIAGEKHHVFELDGLLGVKVGIVQGSPLAELDEIVERRFDFAIGSISRAGAKVSDEVIGLLDEAAAVNAEGGMSRRKHLEFTARSWKLMATKSMQTFGRGLNGDCNQFLVYMANCSVSEIDLFGLWTIA